MVGGKGVTTTWKTAFKGVSIRRLKNHTALTGYIAINITWNSCFYLPSADYISTLPHQ